MVSRIKLEDAFESYLDCRLSGKDSISQATVSRYRRTFKNNILSYWDSDERVNKMDIEDTAVDFRNYLMNNQGYSKSTANKARSLLLKIDTHFKIRMRLKEV